MKIIVDANIVFSAILNTDSKIADLLLNSKEIFDFIAPDYLLTELEGYHQKIADIIRLPIEIVRILESKVTKPISFFSAFHIPESNWKEAEKLVSIIDSKDTPYVAFSMFFDCLIWSGDKVLRYGLIAKGFSQVITTNELYTLRELKRKEQKP